MKPILKWLALFVMLTTICYLIGLLLTGEFKPWLWPHEAKFTFLMFCLISASISTAFIVNDINP